MTTMTPTQRALTEAYADGYQAAMRDINDLLNIDPDRVPTWVRDNLRPTPHETEATQ